MRAGTNVLQDKVWSAYIEKATIDSQYLDGAQNQFLAVLSSNWAMRGMVKHCRMSARASLPRTEIP